MTRRPTASIVASPVLVGAVTVLVSIVAVFLAYNANSGLPFVPTYDLKAELPGGANLVEGNDVRIGGFRVGLVSKITPNANSSVPGRATAIVEMKLDKTVEPLSVDTLVQVRPRSALGLKFIELTPGDGEDLMPGAVIPLENAERPIELDEFFGINTERHRENSRRTLVGLGDAFAGRGIGINRAIEDLVPFMTHLEPVMTALSDPDTNLRRFVQQTGAFSAQLAPVAETYADLFGNIATTFEALTRSPESLREGIERLAPTLETGIRSLPVQRPFLRDTELLSIELEKVGIELQRSLPATTRALRAGVPVQRAAPALYDRTADLFRALDDLAENPSTLLALQDLDDTFDVAAPLLEYVAPYHTVCNYWNYYWTAIGEHVSEPVAGGTIQRVNMKQDNATQDNRISSSEADIPADLPANSNPQTARNQAGQPLTVLHRQHNGAAIDAAGNADCETGQRGYLRGPLTTGNRYAPGSDGGNFVVTDPNTPGLQGPTYVSRRLGIFNLRDVP